MISRQELAKGEQFTKQGDTNLRVGFVLKGILRAYYVTPEGNEFVRSFIPEDELVAAFASAIENVPANIVIEALEDVELLTFDAAAFRGMFARHHAWSELGRILAERYYVLRERHAFQLLTLPGRERFAVFAAQRPDLVRRVPQKHIAGYLGMTPVSLNRVIAALRKEQQQAARDADD